jgi:hypothetical protein
LNCITRSSVLGNKEQADAGVPKRLANGMSTVR